MLKEGSVIVYLQNNLLRHGVIDSVSDTDYQVRRRNGEIIPVAKTEALHNTSTATLAVLNKMFE